MGVFNSLDIFQEKISELCKGFDAVCSYIDVVLTLTKKYFKDNLKALKKYLQKILEAELK